jgi:hypothetical protein
MLALAHRSPNASLNSSHNSTASMNDCAPERHLVDVKCEGAEQGSKQDVSTRKVGLGNAWHLPRAEFLLSSSLLSS